MTEIDEKILLLIKDKNTLDQGFKLLMDIYQKRLYHYIRSIVSSHEDTGDILQNTLMKVFRNIDKFEKRSGLYSWIYRIATNEIYNFLNKKNRQYAFIDNENNDFHIDKPVSGFQPEGEYIKELLAKAIGQLPPKQKMVFSLRYFEERSYNDISEILDTSVGALKASYFHAIRKVEDYLKKNMYE